MLHRSASLLSRRTVSALVLAAAGFAVLPSLSMAEDAAQGETRHHALSLVGEPKFKAGFDKFDWVNVDAPKGGNLRLSVMGSFDSLNPFSIQGEPTGTVGMIFESLMESSPDEPATEYGLIAEWVSYPADYSSATFSLRPKPSFTMASPLRLRM